MNDLAKHAGIEQAQIVDRGNSTRQPFDEMQQALELLLGKHIVNADFGMGTADAVDSAIPLHFLATAKLSGTT